MKLFVAGDIHGDRKAAKELAGQAKAQRADLVVLSGDMTLFGKNHETIVGYFLNQNLKTALIHGNHEDESLVDFLSELYGVTNLHGKARVYDGVGIFACGGANIGPYANSEEEIYKSLIEAYQYMNKIAKTDDLTKKVMVTHVHPSGTKIESFSEFVKGSSGVRRAIESLKPDFVFCSHVHEADGLEEKIGDTQVFCASKKSKFIDLNR